MESALIASYKKETTVFFTEMLNAAKVNQIISINTAGEARRFLLKQDFDLAIVDSPLPDESGENLSRYIASRDASQVIIVVEGDRFDAVSTAFEDDGILVIPKPINETVFLSALKFAGSAQNRLRRIQEENIKLKKRIEDIRIIERAKYTLISYLSMSEHEAHRFIEKQAMDMRSTRRIIAEGILKTYAN